jgi:hypothetical protein
VRRFYLRLDVPLKTRCLAYLNDTDSSRAPYAEAELEPPSYCAECFCHAKKRILRTGESMIVKDRKLVWLAALMAALVISATVPAAALAAEKVTSHWAGTTRARCGIGVTDHRRCGALQNITLTFVQQGSKILGSYTCAYGSQNCRGMQEVGTIIDGLLNGERIEFAVMTPDRSTCRYTGLLANDSGKGNYNCKGGSELGERGSWNIHRSTEGSAPPKPQVPPLLRP